MKMIVYKWVHKKEGKYYSLLNYGYFRLNKSIVTNQAPYEIGKTYINDEIETENLKRQFQQLGSRIPSCVKTGFYFWKENYKVPEAQQKGMIQCGAKINACLKCEVKDEDILSYERNFTCIRAKQFKVLEEINLL